MSTILGAPVLIVDDNASKRLAVKSVLAPVGYRIVEADSGLAALRCVMAENFAVIILDVCMPVMDGFETAAMIRQRRQSEMTPIIFVTAFRSDEMLRADRYAQGAVDFIFSPVPTVELRAKVAVFAALFTRAEALAAEARELQAAADRFRNLVHVAPIGMFSTDSAGRYEYTNPHWSEITGIPAEQAIGQHWDFIFGAPERALLRDEGAIGSEPAESERSHRFEVRVRGTTATTRSVVVTSRALPESARGIGARVGTLSDVTNLTCHESVGSCAS